MDTKLLRRIKELNVFLLFLLICFGCDPVDDKLAIVNQSDEELFFVTSPHSDLSKLYQEGLDQHGVEVKYTNYVEEVEPNATYRPTHFGSGNAWERYINQVCEGGKLRIYTFDLDTLKKYNWKEVIENDLYLKKVELSVDELEKMNWKVTLP
ncbi:hypothetical protein LVD17_27185 [Fulvivirga ulvae]|uniref:hypothetical protein n=1 Tax=Fulvivirga ulvae TaxID=2904245 RepID=UPI001F3F655A|nr:hypothetical protein [Fulvivirga ulvae]UII31976.1 hypothetical protein LVD17_27185 [Fulvivirga ulvae]